MTPLLRTMALALVLVALMAVTMVAPTEARKHHGHREKHHHRVGADPEALAAARASLPYNTSSAMANYLAIEEDVYSWIELPELTEKGDGFVNYVLNVTSLRWLDETKVSRSIWWHFVCIMVPDTPEPRFINDAFLYITGSTNTDSRPPSITSIADWLPQLMLVGLGKQIVVTVFQIPNAPVLFFEETPVPKARGEDALIAWTWKHFLADPSDPTWLARFPMVKSSIAAMNATTEFMAESAAGRPSFDITRWMVAGASKRGLTTWMVGAFDERVIGIVPLVYDELNFVPNIHHHYRSYGGWSFALKDYTDLELTGSFDSPMLQVIQDMVDPYNYLTTSRLATIPKFICSTGGDEFLMNDNVRWFWDALQGEKHFRSFPNLEHSMAGNPVEVVAAALSFAMQIQLDQSRPEYTWSVDATSGAISMVVSPYQGAWPAAVEFWYAPTIKEPDGTYARDWRLATCPDGCPNPRKYTMHNVTWFHDDKYVRSTISGNSLQVTASMDAPENGWVAFVVILTWPDQEGGNFTISSAPSILPLEYPYPDCQGKGCIARLV